MTDTTFIETLKPGDIVIVDEGTRASIGYVARRTKTKIMVTFSSNANYPTQYAEYKFGLNGIMQNGTWSRWHLVEATPEKLAEVQAEIRRTNSVAKLNKVVWNKVSVNALEKVRQILEEDGQLSS